MIRQTDYRDITFRQTCAICRVVFLQQPTMTNFEWAEAVKDTCARQKFLAPEGDMLRRAMAAVERALAQTVGPRRVRDVSAPASVPPPTDDKAWSPHDLKALAETVKRIQARSAGASPVNVRTIPRERWDVSEPAALDEFYKQAETDQLGALKRFAEIAITRPAEWDYAAIREQAGESRRHFHDGICYGCRRHERMLVSHHVIQIQHGGSNYARNRVDICEQCHAAVHPWLTAPPREKSGWFRIGNLASTVSEMVRKHNAGVCPHFEAQYGIAITEIGRPARRAVRRTRGVGRTRGARFTTAAKGKADGSATKGLLS